MLLFVTTRHIGSSPAGLSPAEKATSVQAVSFTHVIKYPLNAPHNLSLAGLSKVRSHHLAFIRLSSYLFGVIFIGCFYYLARAWFGKTIGGLSALVLGLSPFFLIPARLGSSVIMFFWPILLMAIYHKFIKTKFSAAVFWLLILAAGLSVYTPGIIWWLIGSAILCRSQLKDGLAEQTRLAAAAGLLLLLIILAPAIAAALRDWHFIEAIAALPKAWPGPLRIIKNLAWMILALFIKTPHHSPIFIGRLPLLDMIQTGLLVFGAYAMTIAARPKAIALGLSILLPVILAAINDDLRLLLIGLPAAGIFMAAGLRYLYIEWRTVFPRNPIPHTLAIALMSILVAIQLIYGLSYSLAAWPHTSDTKAVYVLK